MREHVYICAALPVGVSYPDIGLALREGWYRNFHTLDGDSTEGSFGRWVIRRFGQSDYRHGHIVVSDWSGQVVEILDEGDNWALWARGEIGTLTGWFRPEDFDERPRPVILESRVPNLAIRLIARKRITTRSIAKTAIEKGRPLWLTRSQIIQLMIANQDQRALGIYLGKPYPPPEEVISRITPCHGPIAPPKWLTARRRKTRKRAPSRAAGKRARSPSKRRQAR